jgi:thiamine-phosphate pyrophosphorylase
LALTFIKTSQAFNVQHILINSNIQLAIKLNASGVHLTSQQFDEIQIAKKNKLFIIVSCHTLDDILKAQKNGANMVTYSPIFKTPNKGNPKGCKNLENVIKQVDIPVIALGGIISSTQIKEIEATNAVGFGSIRYFI